MSLVRSCTFFFFFSLTQSAFPPSLRYPLPISSNKIIDANVTCDSRSLNATITLQQPFKGLLFARDFSHECNSLGTLSNSISITLPTSGCGVRLSSRTDERSLNQMVYSVVLVAQQDRHLRQIADQEKYLECIIKDDAFSIRSQSIVEVLKHDLIEQRKNQRSSRMKKEDDLLETELDQSLSSSRAWMEITPEESSSGTLKVGEVALLAVKSTLPAGIDWKVVECMAHDGLGDSSQKLLDDDGCPIDDSLLPVPEMGPVQAISLMKHQEAVARFAAFKFPDRDRLHLSCYLELCRGFCPKIDCGSRNSSSDNRLGRTLSKGDQGEVLDRLKVFNSVEVLAPAIDDLRTKSDRLQLSEPSTFPFTNLPGDRTFCVSPDKIAITFCVLGVIFLCAVLVAACALFRGRKNGSESPFYTRSLFSSSTSGSAYGSKLLLHDSPSCAGPSPTRRMPYGRIL